MVFRYVGAQWCTCQLQNTLTKDVPLTRGEQVKVKKLDGELARYRDQMKKMRPGPGKVREKQAMLTIS